MYLVLILEIIFQRLDAVLVALLQLLKVARVSRLQLFHLRRVGNMAGRDGFVMDIVQVLGVGGAQFLHRKLLLLFSCRTLFLKRRHLLFQLLLAATVRT